MLQKVSNKYKQLPVQIRASIWFLVASFLQKGISAITTPIFTRLLTTGEFGQYNVFNSWFSIISIIVSLYLYGGFYITGLVQHVEKRAQFSSAMLGLTTTLTAIWTAVYLLFRPFWNELFSLTTVQMLAMLLMIWASSIFQFWAMEQRVDLKYKRLILLTLIVSFFKPFISIVLVVLSEDKVTARILGIALVEMVAYTGCFISQLRRGKRFYVKEYWKEALLFAIPVIPHYLSTMVLSGADRIMIEDLVSDSAAGIYSLAYSVSLMMTLFNTALSQTVDPWIYTQIKEKKTDQLGRVAYPAFLIIAIVNAMVIVFAPEIIKIFAPPAYYEAIWVMPPVTMSVFFMFMYSFFAPFEFFYKKTKFIAIATCAGAVINIILNYIFIQAYGYIAAGYTTLFCYMIYALCHYLFMCRICKDELGAKPPYDSKVLVIMSLGFIGIGFAMMFTYNYSFIRYSIILAIFVLLFVFRKKMINAGKEILSVRKKPTGNEQRAE